MHSEPSKAAMERAAKAICKARYGHLRGYAGREQSYEKEARSALTAAGYTITKEPTV